jgi:aspartate/methionine/tyrosine aminotransferase
MGDPVSQLHKALRQALLEAAAGVHVLFYTEPDDLREVQNALAETHDPFLGERVGHAQRVLVANEGSVRAIALLTLPFEKPADAIMFDPRTAWKLTPQWRKRFEQEGLKVL